VCPGTVSEMSGRLSWANMVLRGQPHDHHDLGNGSDDLCKVSFCSSGVLWDLSANLPRIPGVSEVAAIDISPQLRHLILRTSMFCPSSMEAAVLGVAVSPPVRYSSTGRCGNCRSPGRIRQVETTRPRAADQRTVRRAAVQRDTGRELLARRLSVTDAPSRELRASCVRQLTLVESERREPEQSLSAPVVSQYVDGSVRSSPRLVQCFGSACYAASISANPRASGADRIGPGTLR